MLASEEETACPPALPTDSPIIAELQRLNAEVIQLREAREKDHQELEGLRETLSAVCDILFKQINKKKYATEGQKLRVRDIEKRVLQSPNGYIGLSTLRGELNIKAAELSRLLQKVDENKFIVKSIDPRDKRRKCLCLKARWGVR